MEHKILQIIYSSKQLRETMISQLQKGVRFGYIFYIHIGVKIHIKKGLQIHKHVSLLFLSLEPRFSLRELEINLISEKKRD